MDKITHQVRLEHWTKLLNECYNSGMTKKAWCEENGVSAKQFFYWQRRVRAAAYEQSRGSDLPAVVEETAGITEQKQVPFAEITLAAPEPEASSAFQPDVVIRKEAFTIELSNSASAELLSYIGGMLHAE